MALIKCSECGAEISDKAVRCPKCGAPVSTENNGKPTANQVPQLQPEKEPDFVRKQKKKSKWLWGFIAAFGIIVLGVGLFSSSGNSAPKYYIAIIPSESWMGAIDGYIHKDKECCQSVANYWNSLGARENGLEAEVIKIDRYATAYKNNKGQSVSYDSALGYCTLCWNRK